MSKMGMSQNTKGSVVVKLRSLCLDSSKHSRNMGNWSLMTHYGKINLCTPCAFVTLKIVGFVQYNCRSGQGRCGFQASVIKVKNTLFFYAP